MGTRNSNRAKAEANAILIQTQTAQSSANASAIAANTSAISANNSADLAREQSQAAIDAAQDSANSQEVAAQAAIDAQQAADILAAGGVPEGAVFAWPSGVEPTGFLECDGSTIDPAVYPKLAAVLTNNTLPDLRGQFVRGWDNGAGVDVGRVIGSRQKGTFAARANATQYGKTYMQVGSLDQLGMDDATVSGFGYSYGDNASDANIPFSRDVGDLDENWWGGQGVSRPTNVALMYIIKHD